MNAVEFVDAVINGYKDPSTYELVVFKEWVDKASDRGANFDNIIRELIKTYKYKTFPGYEVYSALYETGASASDATRGRLEALRATQDWSARQVFMKYKKLFWEDETTPLQREFLAFWGDFYSIMCTMIDKKYDKERMASNAEDVKAIILAGDTFEYIYQKYFGEDKVINTFTEIMNDNTRHGIDSVEHYF